MALEFCAHVDRAPIWGLWHKTHQNGPVGIGRTFENLVGVVENNDAEADLHGVEIKAHRTLSSAPVTLFTKSPDVGKNRHLIEAYGYPDEDGVTRFCTSFSATRQTPQRCHGIETTLSVCVSSDMLSLVDQDRPIAVWNRESIERALTKKLKSLAVVDALAQGQGDSEEFFYRGYTLYSGITFERFMSLAAQGAVTIEPRMKLTPQGKVRDRGTAFRVQERRIVDLYENQQTIIHA